MELLEMATRRQAATEYAPFANVESRNGLQARLEIPLMIRALALPERQRILEVGCGRGVALPVFAERLRPIELVGLDMDPALVAIAQKRMFQLGVAATVIEGDVRRLPFPDGSFDLVVDFGTCYHVSGGAAGAGQALSEIARVLRPGGCFAHETPVAQHLAHPLRSFGRSLPWGGTGFRLERTGILWSRRRRTRLA